MKLEYAGISTQNLKSGIDIFAIKDSDRNTHISNIFDKKVSDMLGWVDLPDMSSYDVSNMIEFGKFVNDKFRNFVVLGIGGSALGIKMLKNTFVDSLHNILKFQ